ncbi:MAG: DUF262 domain-containing protein [Chloroflexota bacterium]
MTEESDYNLPEEIEGYGVDEEEVNDADIIEPFKPSLIRIQSRVMTLDLIMERIKNNEIDLAPAFQRKAGIWKDKAKSRLIESILIRIPLPAFYIDATDDNRWVVVDGLQRLTALREFVIDKTLPLGELEFLIKLNGFFYDKLDRNFQRRIGETQVTLYLIEQGTPPEVKFNIFRRINTGGLPLSSQEIRHALNQGPVTDFLLDLSKNKAFKDATCNSIGDARMADRECVLRFFAFTLTPYSEYKSKEFDSFLSDKMAEINKMSDAQRKDLAQRFIRAMVAAQEIFSKDAFRKLYKENGRRTAINKALFESWSVNLDKLNDTQLQLLKNRKAKVRQKFIALMNQPDFDKAISQGTGDVNKIKLRFKSIEDLIVEVIES